MDINARDEFERRILSKGTVKCATIFISTEEIEFTTILKVGYTEENLNDFLTDLADGNYYNGYGAQYLFGTVWMTDGTWFTRYEYDGSECWEHHKCPEIPEKLMG